MAECRFDINHGLAFFRGQSGGLSVKGGQGRGNSAKFLGKHFFRQGGLPIWQKTSAKQYLIGFLEGYIFSYFAGIRKYLEGIRQRYSWLDLVCLT